MHIPHGHNESTIKMRFDDWLCFILGVGAGGLHYALHVANMGSIANIILSTGWAFFLGVVGMIGKDTYQWVKKKMKQAAVKRSGRIKTPK